MQIWNSTISLCNDVIAAVVVLVAQDRGLFNSETAMVSVLHKGLENKVDKLRYKKVEDQKQIRTSSW